MSLVRKSLQSFWSGISDSHPLTLKSVKINSSKNRQMAVHLLVPGCALSVLSYSKYKIAKVFRGFAPVLHRGGLTEPTPNPSLTT